MTETWLPIPGWEDRYEVSDQGRVASIAKDRRIRRPANHWSGYQHIVLQRGGDERVSLPIHRLVLLTFIGEPSAAGMVACHSDGDRMNNHLTNLRWDTPSGNMRDALAQGRHFNASKTHCPQGHPYNQENTYRTARGRYCISCRTARDAASRSTRVKAAAS
jgi:hypothetical protein